jgi:hypothetical protein
LSPYVSATPRPNPHISWTHQNSDRSGAGDLETREKERREAWLRPTAGENVLLGP